MNYEKALLEFIESLGGPKRWSKRLFSAPLRCKVFAIPIQFFLLLRRKRLNKLPQFLQFFFACPIGGRRIFFVWKSEQVVQRYIEKFCKLDLLIEVGLCFPSFPITYTCLVNKKFFCQLFLGHFRGFSQFF